MSVLQLYLPAVLTILGWYILHLSTKSRDHKNKIRELQVNYLIEAYRRLEFVSNRKEIISNKENISDLEKSISDIQLFGTIYQIKLAQHFALDFSKNGFANLDELLIDLRKDLRKELNLEVAPNQIKFLRISIEK